MALYCTVEQWYWCSYIRSALANTCIRKSKSMDRKIFVGRLTCQHTFFCPCVWQ